MKFKLLALISFISSALFSQSGSIEGQIIFEDKAGLSATVSLQELRRIPLLIRIIHLLLKILKWVSIP